jgi:hypothetical protein
MGNKFTRLAKQIEFARNTTLPSAKVALFDGILILVGFTIALGWAVIKKNILLENDVSWIDGIVISLAFFILGWIGIVGIIYEEVPQAVVIRGKAAKAYGIFIVLLSWGIALLALLRL